MQIKFAAATVDAAGNEEGGSDGALLGLALGTNEGNVEDRPLGERDG